MIALFTINPCMDGWEVIAQDTGRPVGWTRPTAQEANGIAFALNKAAADGRLAAALGARED